MKTRFFSVTSEKALSTEESKLEIEENAIYNKENITNVIEEFISKSEFLDYSKLENPKIRIFKNAFYFGEMVNGLK